MSRRFPSKGVLTLHGNLKLHCWPRLPFRHLQKHVQRKRVQLRLGLSAGVRSTEGKAYQGTAPSLPPDDPHSNGVVAAGLSPGPGIDRREGVQDPVLVVGTDGRERLDGTAVNQGVETRRQVVGPEGQKDIGDRDVLAGPGREASLVSPLQGADALTPISRRVVAVLALLESSSICGVDEEVLARCAGPPLVARAMPMVPRHIRCR